MLSRRDLAPQLRWRDNFFCPSGSTQTMYSPGAGRPAFVSLKVKW
ncbi:hypothetical protein ACDW_03360 [Acidovorax sp. DW039]|nr:hypothetical protein ACDW_03360 [Acidovorax sp. DW039]